tara:strand:- start:59 stop:1009 length:951 start_codon:yes stop_codon:yes gene_type:complete
MLQQTRVETVIPYYINFLRKWKNFKELANADIVEVLKAWEGMGYYRRAQNLYRCAVMVSEKLGEKLPRNKNDLLKLPGIGEYTASAICSIGYGESILALDGNVKRVLTRLFFLHSFEKEKDLLIDKISKSFIAKKRSGDFQEAMMDLGALLCKPKNPKCEICPLKVHCLSFKSGKFNSLNSSVSRKTIPKRKGVVFWCIREDGSVFINRRKYNGLLGGLMEFPSSNWDAPNLLNKFSKKDLFKLAPFKANWLELPNRIHHTFSHFHLELMILKAEINHRNFVTSKRDGIWIKPNRFNAYPFPTLMKKIAQYVQKIN